MRLPNISNLEGKVVVVTGGAGVLGETFSHALAEANGKVAILDLNLDRAKEIERDIKSNGYDAFAVLCNVLDKNSIEKAKDEIIAKYGKIDVLINGAGGNHPKGTTNKEYYFNGDIDNDTKSFFNLDQDGINFVFNLNFLGTLLPTQVFAQEMLQNGGSIINVSSMSAFNPLTKIPAYSAAKAAVSNFTEWLSVHFSKAGIRVNAIAPGFFLTKQNESLLLDENKNYTDRANKIINGTPMSRFGKPEELVGTLLFLINEDASSFINGVVLPIDGGYNAYSGV